MSNGPKDRKISPAGGVPNDLNAIDQAMLLATSRSQRDRTPLSLDQEHLLDSWIAGRLSITDAVRAANLAKNNIFAGELVLERRLIAAANEGPDMPSHLDARILKASQPSKSRAAGAFNLRWPTLSGWQWSGLSAAAAAVAVVAVFGFQIWQAQLRSDQSFQIAMVTLEDRSVLFEGARYRTRGSQQPASTPVTTLSDSDASASTPATSLPGAPTATPVTSLPAASASAPTPTPTPAPTPAPTPVTSIPDAPTEGRFRDIEVPTDLLRSAINATSAEKQSKEHSGLMAYLRAQNGAFDSRSQLLIDSVLASSVSENAPQRTNTQVRAYNLDDPRSAEIRNKIQTLQANVSAILLTLRR